jgi:hypothetical protein
VKNGGFYMEYIIIALAVIVIILIAAIIFIAFGKNNDKIILELQNQRKDTLEQLQRNREELQNNIARFSDSVDKKLDMHEMMTLGCEMLKENGAIYRTNNKPNEYFDLWSTNNKVWCTAWDKVIRRDKIKFFCEDTLMEDRVWSYKIADDINWDKVTNLSRIVYVLEV